MIKTLTLDGLTSVTIKQSAYDMARFCWLYNHSESDIFASCVNSECTENADNVLRIPAGEPRMLDTESYETLYLNGSGTVELITSAYSVCPFNRAAKGGGTSLSGSASYTISNTVDYPLMGLNLYGKSTQDGTPTPDTPVDIVSVGDSGSATITVDNGDSISTAAAITSALPLCGFPVDSGGNYTDSNGQQWVCDELIYNADGTGRVVKNIRKYTFTGRDDCGMWTLYSTNDDTKNRPTFMFSNENIKPIYNKNIFSNDTPSRIICDKYKSVSTNDTYFNLNGISVSHIGGLYLSIYDDNYAALSINDWVAYISKNPITVVYQLNTPQEIPLTAAEMSALRQLQTFNDITNISNDGGADMDVYYCTNKTLSEYVFPITTGLQKQIDELQAAILSLGSNV